MQSNKFTFEKAPFISDDSGKDNQQQTKEEYPPENDPLSLESIFFNEIKEVDGKKCYPKSNKHYGISKQAVLFPRKLYSCRFCATKCCIFIW